MYGRLMLTKLGYIDGKCYHDHSIHTDPMGIISHSDEKSPRSIRSRFAFLHG